jgi:hypothetical protein
VTHEIGAGVGTPSEISGRWRDPERPLQDKLSDDADRPIMAGDRHCCNPTDRPLSDVQQPAERRGPPWPMEPPLGAAGHPSLDAPLLPIGLERSGPSRTSLRGQKLLFAPPLRLIGSRMRQRAIFSLLWKAATGHRLR